LSHFALCLLALSPLAAASCATPTATQGSAPAAAVAPAKPTAAAQESIFGSTAVVHGRRITDDEIKRFLCASVGGRDFDTFKFAIMVDQELDRRRKDGATEADLAKFDVSEAELEARLKREKDDFFLRYPTLDFALEVGRAEGSLELFKLRLHHTMRFDKVFRPENPIEWPEITKAIITEQLGEQWLDDEKVSYAARCKRLFETEKTFLSENGHSAVVAAVEQLDPKDTITLVEVIYRPESQAALAALKAVGRGDIPADDPIAVEAVRGTILQTLNDWAIVHLDPDAIAANLPPASADSPKDAASALERANKVFALVEGQPILMETIWSRIAPTVTPDQVDEAKRFLAHLALIEHELGQKGKLITQAEFREWWPSTARMGKPSYTQYLNQHEMLSSQVLGFPSLWAFGQYMRVQEGYKRLIAEELKNDDLLQPLLPVINQIAGASKLSVNVILVSAYDFVNVRWKPEGFADARERALAIKSDLDKGAEWKPTLELYSEFWDPPMPDTGNKPMQNFYFKGTFGDQPQTRNQLQSYIGDNDYRAFLYGPTVTDTIFFDQKMGSIDGPYRGPKGYYIARITGKTPYTKPLDLNEPKHREIVEYFYLKSAMAARALASLREGVEKGTVTGLTPPPPLRD
ncbi:MAG: hypothetical protein NTV21_15660, partial [Planctomycetota bacterium]|nr:hypothetical protein [Planctomycetota bacterium]